ncbi:DUF5319 domain-containing protein [Candidatus Woesearchaeota archaeon]|nr:DUF5319 domain-containing protein [Candidatus Woesearchaeota archaeon]
MVKKCIICSKEAEFKIKDCNEFYCEECAEEHFADLSLLQGIEEEARALKKVVLDNLNGNTQNNQDLEN